MPVFKVPMHTVAHLTLLSAFLAGSQGVENEIADTYILLNQHSDSVGHLRVGLDPLRTLTQFFLASFHPISHGNRVEGGPRYSTPLNSVSVQSQQPSRNRDGSNTERRARRASGQGGRFTGQKGRFSGQESRFSGQEGRFSKNRHSNRNNRQRFEEEEEEEEDLDDWAALKRPRRGDTRKQAGYDDAQKMPRYADSWKQARSVDASDSWKQARSGDAQKTPRYVDPRKQAGYVDSRESMEGWTEDAEADEHGVATTDGGSFAPRTWNVEVPGEKKASFFAKESNFSDLGASDELETALAAVGITRPSKVQAEGFPPILAGKDVILADQTGSGKTIAYLAPIVQALRSAEESLGRTPGGFVRAVVIVPTSELAMQVLSIAKAISASGMPFRSAIVTGGHPFASQKQSFKKGLELVVCTPGRLRQHLTASPEPTVSLDQVNHIVLDEADILFADEDFDATWNVLRDATPVSASFSLVTATLPDALVKKAQREMPMIKVMKGKNLHRTATGVQETIIDCSLGKRSKERRANDEDMGFKVKSAALLHELANHPADRVMVFCNTIENCRKVENALRRRDRKSRLYDLSVLHGAIEPETRKANLVRFTRKPEGLPHILVCTDRASRGMDFPDVRHVVLFDFPRDGIEYVRRVGRATRGTGTPGRVTSLVVGRQISYARELMKTNREGGMVNVEDMDI